jgi:mRNA interferase RelE/StbE
MYQIEFTKGAIKQLNKLPSNIKERINAKILDLAIEPCPDELKK